MVLHDRQYCKTNKEMFVLSPLASIVFKSTENNILFGFERRKIKNCPVHFQQFYKLLNGVTYWM